MKYTYTILCISALALLPACHDDKSSPSAPLQSRIYDSSSGLELTYNGYPMPGKTVKVVPSGDKIALSIYSLINLSQLKIPGADEMIPAPGAIPGSPETNLEAPLSAADGGWSFSGNSSTDFCTFSYSGTITDDALKLNLENVKLKSGGVTPETWQPSPIEKNSDGTYKSLPFYIDWDYSPLPNTDINLAPIVEAIATMPIIPVYNNTAYMSVSQALSLILKTVDFRPDGNMIFTYVSTAFGAAQIAQTLPNRFQYVIDSPNTVRLFIDPMSLAGLILVNTSGSTPATDVDLTDKGLFPATKAGATTDEEMKLLRQQLTASALKYFLPMIAEGIPVDFSAGKEGLHVYIDTQMAMDMLRGIVLPVLEKDASMTALAKYIKSQPQLEAVAGQIEKLLPLLPEAFMQTNRLRIGFSFIPYAGQP